MEKVKFLIAQKDTDEDDKSLSSIFPALIL